MNTKIYKRVLSLTGELLTAAEQKNQKRFDGYYAELKGLCEEHENTDKDHPVQWETLADFTEELTDAVVIYEKAFKKAKTINDKDFLSSIGFSLAQFNAELGHHALALTYAEQAKVDSNKIADKELKAEIHDLLLSLSDKP